MSGRVRAIAVAVMTDALRRKVVWIIGVFAVAMAIAIPSLPSYGVGVAAQVFRQVAQALTYLAAMVLGLSLSANRIPAEVERRTVFNVLTRETRRWEYVAGTWLGIFGVLAAAVAAFCVVTQVVAVAVYGDPMWRLWQGALAVLLECGVVAALAVAVSTRLGPVTVVVSALAFLFVAHTGSSIALLMPPSIARLVPSLDVFSIVSPVAHGNGVTAGYLAMMVVAFAAWSALLVSAGALAFGGRDL